MRNDFLYRFNGHSIEHFEALLFQVDHAHQIADFRPDQRQAEIDFYSRRLYDSASPTFGRALAKNPGFSFGLDAFQVFMKLYFRDNQRDLNSPLFNRSCQVVVLQFLLLVFLI
jgi:hypothetical protein